MGETAFVSKTYTGDDLPDNPATGARRYTSDGWQTYNGSDWVGDTALGTSSKTNTVEEVFRVTHKTTGTPADGIGVGIELAQETTDDNVEVIGVIEAIALDVTSGTEDGAISFKTMKDGAAATEDVRINSADAALDVEQGASTGAKPVLKLEQKDVSEEIVSIACTVGSSNGIVSAGGTLSSQGFLKIKVNGTARYIEFGNIT